LEANVAHEALRARIAELEAVMERAGIYDVTCARCGKVGLTCDMYIEEGDEWECPPCNDRENARERREIQETL
jgi:hypothetical protein